MKLSTMDSQIPAYLRSRVQEITRATIKEIDRRADAGETEKFPVDSDYFYVSEAGAQAGALFRAREEELDLLTEFVGNPTEKSSYVGAIRSLLRCVRLAQNMHSDTGAFSRADIQAARSDSAAVEQLGRDIGRVLNFHARRSVNLLVGDGPPDFQGADLEKARAHAVVSYAFGAPLHWLAEHLDGLRLASSVGCG